MDYTLLFGELLKLSPFVATLFAFLWTIWRSMQKKDEALMSTMKENTTNMIILQKSSIEAQNNATAAHRELAGAIFNLKETIISNNQTVRADIGDINERMTSRSANRPRKTTPAPNAVS